MMPGTLRNAILLLSSVRLLPQLILMSARRNHKVVFADLERWAKLTEREAPKNKINFYLLFIELMTFHQEYRTVYCLRTGLTGRLLSVFCRRMPTLAVKCDEIGLGFFIRHGHGSFMSAKKVGSNCTIHQLVTIGYGARNEGPPTIGDNVTIYAGATIVGDIRLGNNSIVAANSLVIGDVPANCLAIGVPAKILPRLSF
jgi:serine O-acetyltransferase